MNPPNVRGVPMFVIGLLLLLVVRPIVDGIWFVGGTLTFITVIAGLAAAGGGGYMIAKSLKSGDKKGLESGDK